MPIFAGRFQMVTPGNPFAGFKVVSCTGDCPGALDGRRHTAALHSAALSGAPAVVVWHREPSMGGMAVVDSVTLQAAARPQAADPPQGTPVNLIVAVKTVPATAGNIWSTDQSVSCGGTTLMYCASFLTTSDPGIAMTLRTAQNTGMQLTIMGTDTGQTMGGVPLVMVTSAAPVSAAPPSPAPSPSPAPAPPAMVSISAAYDPVGAGNLWLTNANLPCSGTPGFCPAYLTSTDAGVITNLNMFASTGMQVTITGTDTGMTIGGIPVIRVTSAVPSGLTQLNQLLQPFGVTVPQALQALGNLGISISG